MFWRHKMCLFAKRSQRAERAFSEDLRRLVRRQGDCTVYLVEGSSLSVGIYWSITSALFAPTLKFNYLSESQDRLVLNGTVSVWCNEHRYVDMAIVRAIKNEVSTIPRWWWHESECRWNTALLSSWIFWYIMRMLNERGTFSTSDTGHGHIRFVWHRIIESDAIWFDSLGSESVFDNTTTSDMIRFFRWQLDIRQYHWTWYDMIRFSRKRFSIWQSPWLWYDSVQYNSIL